MNEKCLLLFYTYFFCCAALLTDCVLCIKNCSSYMKHWPPSRSDNLNNHIFECCSSSVCIHSFKLNLFLHIWSNLRSKLSFFYKEHTIKNIKNSFSWSNHQRACYESFDLFLDQYAIKVNNKYFIKDNNNNALPIIVL